MVLGSTNSAKEKVICLLKVQKYNHCGIIKCCIILKNSLIVPQSGSLDWTREYELFLLIIQALKA